MDRKEFLQGCCALAAFSCFSSAGSRAPKVSEDPEFKFVQNWLTDLTKAMDAELDQPTKIKLMSACGRGCFNRFKFKQDLAAQGKGSADKLIEALKKNFECWREGDTVHVRYGKVSQGCYCPAAKYRETLPNDFHCYCTRATHEVIWETALGKPVKIDILETVRRGNPTCHFLVHLT
jgi:hypothetical protein